MTFRHFSGAPFSGQPALRLLLGGVFLVALIVVLTAYETLSRRERAYADVERDLKLLAVALGGYTERTFQSLELMLRNIEADLQPLRLDQPAGQAAASRILRLRHADFPMVSSLNLLDPDGDLLASALPVPEPRPHYGDRDYFREARARPESRRIYIGRPIFGRKSQRWAIPVILNRHDAQGRLTGMIYAGLDIEKLTEHYRSTIAIDGAIASLYRDDARLLARLPAAAEAFDRDHGDIGVFRERQARSPDGFYRERDAGDDTPRSTAYRSLGDFGLLLTISASEERIESAWNRTLALPLTIGLSGLLLCATLLGLAVRQWRSQRELQARFVWQANHDAATALPNRFLFEDRLQKAIHSAGRHRSPLALMFIDLDNFKRINDSLGHAAGDEVLRTAAVWLRTCIRESDTVARFGGDEFAILLPELARESDVGVVAAKILQQFNTPMHIGEHVLTITASIGIATFPRDGDAATPLMASADAAMYKAKAGGRNLACHFNQGLADEIGARMQIETHLQAALERDEFSLVFQPIVDARNGLPVAVEALLRWHSPELGEVPPDAFIPVADSIGLMPALGARVLERACREAAGWPEIAGLALRLSVNVSARELEQPDFAGRVHRALTGAGLPAARLLLELADAPSPAPATNAARQLQAVRALGVTLALDHFGGPQSSLTTLSRLDLQMLKLDHTRCARIEDDPAERKLLRALVAFAQPLGLPVVGQGVENDNQRLLLGESGCRWLQGYLFARPLPPDAFVDWLQAQKAAAGRVTG